MDIIRIMLQDSKIISKFHLQSLHVMDEAKIHIVKISRVRGCMYAKDIAGSSPVSSQDH